MAKREKERLALDSKPGDNEYMFLLINFPSHKTPSLNKKELEIKSITNGVVKLQITNCESMWAKNGFESSHNVTFEFTYRRVKTNDYDKNLEIDKIWRAKNIGC